MSGVRHDAARAVRRGPGSRIAVNMTPMIDVVFLLLIYFMVATDFVATEEVYRLDLPERQAAGSDADPFTLELEPLRIVVSTTGAGHDDYAIRLVGPWEQPPSFEALRRFLERSRVTGAGVGLFATDHPILVAPEASAAWEHAVEAFNAAVAAGYRNVQFVPTT